MYIAAFFVCPSRFKCFVTTMAVEMPKTFISYKQIYTAYGMSPRQIASQRRRLAAIFPIKRTFPAMT